jgi:uroporphyrinogen decarboxylase
MNARDRVLKTLNHEEPDKVPSFELSIDNLMICKHYGLQYYLQDMSKSFKKTFDLCKGDRGIFTKTIQAAIESRSYLKNAIKNYLDLYFKSRIDLVNIPLSGYYFFPIICEKDYLIDEYGRIFDLKLNPTDGMDIAYYREGHFKSLEDFEDFPSLNPENPRREKMFKIMKKVEETYLGKLYSIPAIWGIFESSWQAFGFVNFSKLLSNSKTIKKLIDSRGNFALELTKCFIDWGETGAILLYDDLGFKSGLLTRPEVYKEYVFPWYKQICEYANKKGVKIILHSCGDLFPIFEDLINAGFHGVHPIEPTTANPEYDIFKLNEKYGGKISFIGNVSPQDLADKDPKFIEEYTKKLITELGPGGGYILSSGHSINPAVKLENFLMMHKTLEKFGSYPIKKN